MGLMEVKRSSSSVSSINEVCIQILLYIVSYKNVSCDVQICVLTQAVHACTLRENKPCVQE